MKLNILDERIGNNLGAFYTKLKYADEQLNNIEHYISMDQVELERNNKKPTNEW